MTNTLHRKGTDESLAGDFVVFLRVAKGYNEEGSEDKMRTFRRMALRHHPVLLGGVTPEEMEKLSPEEIVERRDPEKGLIGLATFDSLEAVSGLLADLKSAGLGLSVNVSGLLGKVEECCQGLGITRHSVEQSLGILGRTERLPSEVVLELSTMCGHGMVSANLIWRMVDLVKRRKLTSKRAAQLLARPCVCGCFNTARAELLLEKLRTAG